MEKEYPSLWAAHKQKIRYTTTVVDVPPSVVENEITLKSDNIKDVTIKLTKEDLHQLFQFRNLAFLATLSKNGSPHVTPVWAEMVDDLILINTLNLQQKIGT
jgi:predicted pyridoxine 5'-phosphate oxidase superfamily flavin-nucleotide-binding protein